MVQLSVEGVKLKNVLLNGRSTVNIININVYKKLGKITLLSAPFNQKLVDSHKCYPLGMIYHLSILLSGIKYLIDVIILHPKDSATCWVVRVTSHAKA